MTISNTELRERLRHSKVFTSEVRDAILRLLDENQRLHNLLVEAFTDTRSCTCLNEIEEKFRAG